LIAIENKIILDRKTFKALASDTRVKILKHLNAKRMTLSELSKSLDMSVSTIKEHLDSLSSVELVEQRDEGRKWKYYELTRKGKNIVNPVETKVFIILSLSILAMFVSVYRLINKLLLRPLEVTGEKAQLPALGPIPYLEITLVVLSVLVVGICLRYLLTKRKIVDLRM